MSDQPPDIEVRGGATADELAAIAAVLRDRRDAVASVNRYERWRRERIKALASRR